MLTLAAKLGGPMRGQDFRRGIQGVSQKTLAKTSRNQGAGGLLTRTVYNGTPLRAEYQLSPLGGDSAARAAKTKLEAKENMTGILPAQQ